MQGRGVDRWIVILLVGCIAAMVALVMMAGPAMKQVDDAKVFGDRLLRDLGGTWDSAPLIKVATPEFVANTGASGPKGLLDAIERELGKMESFQSRVEGIESRPIDGSEQLDEIANYYAEGKFTKGAGRIDITLIRTETGWKVARFSGRKL